MVQWGGQGLNRAECPLRVGLRLGDRKGGEDIKGVTGYTIQDLAWSLGGWQCCHQDGPPCGAAREELGEHLAECCIGWSWGKSEAGTDHQWGRCLSVYPSAPHPRGLPCPAGQGQSLPATTTATSLPRRPRMPKACLGYSHLPRECSVS